MDFGQAFSFQFKDPDWFKKLAIVGLILLIPLIGQIFLLGYGLEITRRIINRESELLPDIDFGGQLGKGFQLFIVQLVYTLPIWILSLPSYIVPMITSGNGNADETLATVAVAITLCCGILQLLYSLFIAFVFPAAWGRLAATGSIGSAFQLGEVIGLVRRSPVSYLLVVLGSLVAGFIAPLGLIACIIGVVLTIAYSGTIVAHLTGQAYRQATGV